MSQWLKDFIRAKTGEEEQAVFISVTAKSISRFEALNRFNAFIRYQNGNGHPMLKIRLSALERFLRNHNPEGQRALFDFFCEYMPHWQCTQEFSSRNMKAFVVKLSNSNIFLSRPFNPSITAPKFKTVLVRLEPEKTASIQRKSISCSIHELRDACRKSNSPIPLCQGCRSALHWAIKKGKITKDSTRRDILLYLENRREEKNKKIKKVRKISQRTT